MTNKPEIRLGGTLVPGVLAVVLFVVMGLVVWNTQFGQMTGFPEGLSITSEIGYAMFDLEALQSSEGAVGSTEPFLAAFLLIAVTLDAALDASLVLAKREEEGEPIGALPSQRSGSASGSDTQGSGRTAASDGGQSLGDATGAGEDGGDSR